MINLSFCVLARPRASQSCDCEDSFWNVALVAEYD